MGSFTFGSDVDWIISWVQRVQVSLPLFFAPTEAFTGLRGVTPPPTQQAHYHHTHTMKFLYSTLAGLALIASVVDFVHTSTAATAVFAAGSPKTLAKQEALEKVAQAFEDMESFRKGEIPITERVVRFHEALVEVKAALKSGALTSEEVGMLYSKKPWFFAILSSVKAIEEAEKELPADKKTKVGWMTPFWLADQIVNAKAFWFNLKEAGYGKTPEELRSTLRKLEEVQKILHKNSPEFSRGTGSFGWLDDIVSKEKGDFMKNFPTFQEIKAVRSVIEQKLEQMAPTSKDEAPKKAPRSIGPVNPKDLAAVGGIRVSF